MSGINWRKASALVGRLRRLSNAILAVAFLSGLLTTLALPQVAHAADTQITARKLTLIGVGTDGGSKPLGDVNHLYNFTINDFAATLGSIRIEYCTTAANSVAVPACVAPTGLDVTGVTLGAQTGATGFSITGTPSGNLIIIDRTPAAAGGAATAVSYRFDSIINPTAVGTFYARITTHANQLGTGTVENVGTVAASTANQLSITGNMPESLVFCTAEDITANGGGVPDCSTATDSSIAFNDLFSATATRYAISEMAASTNATTGYVITVSGPTMTSGGNTITAIGGTATAPSAGTGQFGLNLVDNATPNVGAAITLASTVANRQAKASANFDTADTYAFTANSTQQVAASDDDTPGTPLPTDGQIYTASYIVNVPGSQPAGTYTSTLTYICTPTF